MVRRFAGDKSLLVHYVPTGAKGAAMCPTAMGCPSRCLRLRWLASGMLAAVPPTSDSGADLPFSEHPSGAMAGSISEGRGHCLL